MAEDTIEERAFMALKYIGLTLGGEGADNTISEHLDFIGDQLERIADALERMAPP